MLIICKSVSELDIQQLLSVYEQSNFEKGKREFPYDLPDRQIMKAEDNFVDYLSRDFFGIKDACYCIWAENGIYFSALRLEPFCDGFLLCALETKPQYRQRGYAAALVNAVLDNASLPIYSHISRNNSASITVHKSCGFAFLHEGAKLLDGTVSAKYDTYMFVKK